MASTSLMSVLFYFNYLVVVGVIEVLLLMKVIKNFAGKVAAINPCQREAHRQSSGWMDQSCRCRCWPCEQPAGPGWEEQPARQTGPSAPGRLPRTY